MPTIKLPHNFRPRDYQLPILKALDAGVTRAVAVWHRRSGKEKTFLNYMIKKTAERVGTYFYLFPTYTQAKKAIWDGMDKDGFPFLSHFPAEYIKRKNESELRVELINGSAVQLVGSDNIDAVMSTNPIGVVLAEYSLQDPKAWEYLRPILKENGGWAIFDYTPRGKNHGYTLYEMARRLQANGDPNWFAQRLTVEDTHVLTPDDIEAERREGMSEDMIAQEYYCSFQGVQGGSIFGKQLQEADNAGRICAVPWHPDLPVDTWWDIGSGDATAIWFTQNVGREVHVIDYLEDSGPGIDHYAKLLQEMPYVYGAHNGPHDLQNRSFAANGKSTFQIAAGLGIRFNVVQKLDKTSQLNAGRAFFAKCYFDLKKTERGRSALISYHYQWDDKRKVFSASPYHDWSSNGADAWMQLAVGHKYANARKEESAPRRMQSSNESNTSWMGA